MDFIYRPALFLNSVTNFSCGFAVLTPVYNHPVNHLDPQKCDLEMLGENLKSVQLIVLFFNYNERESIVD